MGEEKGGGEGESLTWAHLVLFDIIIAVGNVVGGRKGEDLYINPLFYLFFSRWLSVEGEASGKGGGAGEGVYKGGEERGHSSAVVKIKHLFPSLFS